MINVLNPPYSAAPGTECYFAIQAALSTGDTVYIPAAQAPYYLGNVLVSTHSNQKVYGDGCGTRLSSTHPSANIVQVGDGSAPINNFILQDVLITAALKKTAGAAVKAIMAGRHRYINVMIGLPEEYSPSSNNLFRGFDLDGFDNCSIMGGGVIAQDDLVRMNGHSDQSWGAGLWIGGGIRLLFGTNAIRACGAVGGLDLGQLDASKCGTALRLDTSVAAVNNREVFVSDDASLDSCQYGIYGAANAVGDLDIAQAWIASHSIAGLCFENAQAAAVLVAMEGAKLRYNAANVIKGAGLPVYFRNIKGVSDEG